MEIYKEKHSFCVNKYSQKYFPCVSKTFPVLQQNSLCFPCLEEVRTKFSVFPVPWPPCDRGVPPSILTGEGYPIWLRGNLGIPSCQDQMGVPPIRTGLGYPPPPAGLNGGTPPPNWDCMGVPPPSGLDGGTPRPPLELDRGTPPPP